MTRRSLDQVIESFGDSIQPGDVALFYYSGHGLQVAGENYLVPVDANIKKESEVRVKTVPINLLFAKLDGIPRAVNIVVLDACRNNPFARSFRSSSGGLAQMSAPTGTLVAFSTAPGQVAEDGSGNNSTYTEALARHMKEPNLSVENVFKKVRTEVMDATHGVQTPWENTSLTGNFKFIDAAAMEAALARQGASKSAELERLLKMEAEAKAAKKKEKAELAKRQAELDKMDAEIASMKSRLGAGKATGNDSLKNMVSLVKQRENQAKQLEKLKAEKAEQERKRQEEIERLKALERENRRPVVEAAIADYETVVNSPYGKDMAVAAWQSLIASYPEAKKLERGDISGFRRVAIEGLSVEEVRKGNKLLSLFEMVKVPKGCFRMGDNDGFEDEKPQHRVCVDSFSMGKYEVTNSQYRKFKPEYPRYVSRYLRLPVGHDKQPVSYLSWEDAVEYTEWLSRMTGKKFRLPTEAEWEYAARAGTTTQRYWGDDPELTQACKYDNVRDQDLLDAYIAKDPGFASKKYAVDPTFKCRDGHLVVAPVGQFLPNAFGLYDMLGNASEWTQDWFSKRYYASSPVNNPKGPKGGDGKVLRGGHSGMYSYGITSSSRSNMKPTYKGGGIRLVVEN